MMIDKDWSSKITQQHHKGFSLATLVSSQYDDNSIFRKLSSLAVDGQTSSGLELLFSFGLSIKHPLIKRADSSFFVGDIEDDS